ncbi:hypothetical protein [Flavobacterium odoriferum]|uniref:hypothetical protein n=1 Tax=Flavobacterium odoriferum TaxID=2946604 RepID=UPI0021CAF13E|nr:hypothetical protein [Flavobacterium sp. HXWNR29]
MMIKKVDISNEEKNCSFKNAHILNEFAKALHKVGDDIENSVGVFDAIGEKTEIFSKLEETIQRPAIESLIHMQDISQGQIYNFVFKSFEDTFKKYESNFNFIHFANSTDKDLTFFISVKDEKIKETLENLEYDYFTSEIHNYLDVNFCFLELDMENNLSNTEKLILSA